MPKVPPPRDRMPKTLIGIEIGTVLDASPKRALYKSKQSKAKQMDKQMLQAKMVAIGKLINRPASGDDTVSTSERMCQYLPEGFKFATEMTDCTIKLSPPTFK